MIEKDQVQHIAKLARIQLSKEEIERYQKELSSVVEYFDVLKEAQTKDVVPMTHVAFQENVAREDMPQKEDAQRVAALLQLAPAVKDGFLKVKTILSFK